MSQNDFEQFLKTAPASAGYELIGRQYNNAFGIKEAIVLHQNYWDYLDWLIEFAELDADDWIAECDKHREDKTLSENLMVWLYWDECDRHRQGHATPTDTPPYGYNE